MTWKDVKKPNFFIIGAPKCGTTALSEYLKRHPQIFMSKPKEPSYFAVGDPYLMNWPCNTEEKYEKCFLGSRDGNYKAIGEASVWYLYSKSAVKKILRFNENAKFIVMLRNPIDLLASLHSQYLFQGDEDVECFERAWRLQDSRLNGENIPLRCSVPHLLQYRDIGKLGQQIRRLFNVVSKNKVKIIIFDDFINNTAKVYKDVLVFLGVDPDFDTEFEIFNPNKSFRSHFFRRIYNYIAYWSSELKKMLNIEDFNIGVLSAIKKVNITYRKREHLPIEFKKELIEYFKEDIILLSKTINRDLSNWIKI